MKGMIFTEDGVKCIFDEAEELENIKSGESADVIFGKIQKWFSYFSEFSSFFDSNGNLILPADVTATDPSGKSVSLCSMKKSLSKAQDNITELQRSLGMTKGKNLLKNTAATTTESGVTFTRNSDGSITCNGTATQGIQFLIGEAKVAENTDYIISGCPTGGNPNKYFLVTSKGAPGNLDFGNGKTFNSRNCSEVEVSIYIREGQTVSNITFYPMLRYASITDSSYEPYVDDVQTQINELKAQIAALTATNNTEE